MNNNHNKSSKKTILYIIIVAVVLAIVYFYYNGGSPSANTLSSDNTASTRAIGAQVLSILNQVNSLKIDTSIFSDPGYRTLVDYSVVIPEQNVGRINPFAPIPGFSTTPPPTKKK